VRVVQTTDCSLRAFQFLTCDISLCFIQKKGLNSTNRVLEMGWDLGGRVSGELANPQGHWEHEYAVEGELIQPLQPHEVAVASVLHLFLAEAFLHVEPVEGLLQPALFQVLQHLHLLCAGGEWWYLLFVSHIDYYYMVSGMGKH
jgi:hypothetical protein